MARLLRATAILIICTAVSAAVAGENHDRLPVGPSVHRYELRKIEADRIVDTRSDETVTLAQLVERALESDVIMIGEFHDSYECHRFQRDFIERVVTKHPRIIVGFEFFTRDDNRVLERWRRGNIEEDGLIQATGWYAKTALNYGYTGMVMDVIRQYGIRVIGLNVPRSILRTVSRKGLDALDERQRSLFPTVGIANREHRYLIQQVFGAMAVQIPAWFDNIYAAQVCWDAVMAESMRRELALPGNEGYKGIVIAGSLHVAYRLGIPFRYARSDGGARISTIVPLSVESREDTPTEHPMLKAMGSTMKPAAIYSRGIADFVFSLPASEEPYFPVLGVRGTFEKGRYVVDRVIDGGIAARHGLKEGDAIVAIDGESLKSREHFRMRMAGKRWGHSLKLTVEKSIGIEKNAGE